MKKPHNVSASCFMYARCCQRVCLIMIGVKSILCLACCRFALIGNPAVCWLIMTGFCHLLLVMIYQFQGRSGWPLRQGWRRFENRVGLATGSMGLGRGSE